MIRLHLLSTSYIHALIPPHAHMLHASYPRISSASRISRPHHPHSHHPHAYIILCSFLPLRGHDPPRLDTVVPALLLFLLTLFCYARPHHQHQHITVLYSAPRLPLDTYSSCMASHDASLYTFRAHPLGPPPRPPTSGFHSPVRPSVWPDLSAVRTHVYACACGS